jgi:hypothetical protein
MRRPVSEPMAAFLVTTLALTADVLTRSGTATRSLADWSCCCRGTFTVALTEPSTRHLAGTRLSSALVVFLGIGFGVALGANWAPRRRTTARDIGRWRRAWLSRAALPGSEWIALLVAPLAFHCANAAPAMRLIPRVRRRMPDLTIRRCEHG